MADDPEVRTCDKCGLEDTEPHHVQYVAFNHPIDGAGVDLSVTKHIACCAADGCPICSTDVRQAEAEGVDVHHLSDFVQSRSPELQQELFEQFGVESPDFQIPTTAEES